MGIEQVELKAEIKQIITDLDDLNGMGFSRMELIEVAKLGVLHEINERIDTYCADRIETDKVVLAILKDFESRAVVVQMEPKALELQKKFNTIIENQAAFNDRITDLENEHKGLVKKNG